MFMIAMVEVNACGSVKFTAMLVEGAVEVLATAPRASRIISETLRLEFRRVPAPLARLGAPLVNTPGLLLLIACKEEARELLGLLFSNGIPLPKLRRNIPVSTVLGWDFKMMICFCCV